MEIKAPGTDSFLPLGEMSPGEWMDPAERGNTKGLKAGDVGTGRARGHRRTVVAPRPRLCCMDQTSHYKNTFFKAKKSLFALGGDFWLFPVFPDRSWTGRSVDGSLPKATVI